MLKNTLHTAIAAIAVSTMFLPTAEAREDLVLEAEGAKWYTVATPSLYRDRSSGELEPISLHSGTVKFAGKVLETHWSERVATEWYQGSHPLCAAGTTQWGPYESSILLRGSNPGNTLTMDTVSMEDSSDPTNMHASVLCYDGYQNRVASAAWTYRITEATGKWSCAFTRDNLGIYFSGELPSYTQTSAPRPFRSIYFDRVEGVSQGAIIIPRPCSQ